MITVSLDLYNMIRDHISAIIHDAYLSMVWNIATFFARQMAMY